MKLDVIIAGMGPTGATLAALLGQRGLRVLVLDKLPGIYPLPRAAGIDHEVMRIMQELGIAERILEYTAPYRPSEYRGMQGQLIKRLDMAPPPFRLGWAPNYVFDQPAFERIIRERVSELPSVQVHLQAEVVADGQDDAKAWVDVRMPGRERVERFEASYLVACDGGSSPIRSRQGIALEDLQFHEPWLVVDAIIDDDKLGGLPQTQVQYCEADRPCTYVVLPGNHRRWEIMLLPGDSLSPEFPESELWPLLQRWIKPGDGRLWRAAAYRFHGLVAKQWRQGRLLLAGDAAHMTPPFMAQGMVQGMRDAMNLAWKLDRVLAAKSPAALLDTYGEERRPHVSETTRTAIALGRVICERDPERARERDARLIAEQGGVVKTAFRQNMIPDLKTGLIEASSPGAGSLFPQPHVRAARSAVRLDDLTGRGLRAVVLGEITPEMEASYAAALLALDGRLIHLGEGRCSSLSLHIDEEEAVLAPWLDGLRQRVAIVRPDNYVYGTAATPAEGLVLLGRLAEQLADRISLRVGPRGPD
jgi:3-(3-hydroxy-phenyl)propionate hydroxylase